MNDLSMSKWLASMDLPVSVSHVIMGLPNGPGMLWLFQDIG